MSRRNPHIVSFRATDELLERLLRFAIDNGLYNGNDEPNVSAAVLLLVSAGFGDHRGQQSLVLAYEAARGALLDEVRLELAAALGNVAKRIR